MPNFLQQQLAALQRGGNAVGNGVTGLLNSWNQAAEATGVPQAIGGATGALGGALGGTIGGLGNFFDRSLHGQGFDPSSMRRDIGNTAASTAHAGYQMGKEGAKAAPLANAGKVVSGALAIPNAMGVANDIRSGHVGLGTGLKAGAAALGAYGAASQPNWLPGGAFQNQMEALVGKLGIPGAGTSRPVDLENFGDRAAAAGQRLQQAAEQDYANGPKPMSNADGLGDMKFSSGAGANYPGTFEPNPNGLDTGTNYGENLMNNDGGPMPSAMGVTKPLPPDVGMEAAQLIRKIMGRMGGKIKNGVVPKK